MKRRIALKNLAAGSGSLILLPFWMQSCSNGAGDWHRSSFSPEEQDLLAAVADTIIPAGHSIGALSLGIDRFLQKIFDDCYEKPIQDNIRTQLHALEDLAKKSEGKSFAACSQEQRQTLLLRFSVSSNKPEKDFFDLVKSETIRGFNSSQKVMEDYFHYKVAPGHYYGCIPINT